MRRLGRGLDRLARGLAQPANRGHGQMGERRNDQDNEPYSPKDACQNDFPELVDRGEGLRLRLFDQQDPLCHRRLGPNRADRNLISVFVSG